MEEIAYPEGAGYVRDIKFGEKGEIYLSMEKPNEDVSRSRVTAWKREKGSESWTKLYEKEFVSSTPDETVEVNLKFLNEGALIKESFYGREDLTKSHANLYYIDSFEGSDLNKVFTSKQIRGLICLDFSAKSKVVAEDYVTGTIKILNLESETIEELRETERSFFSCFDGQKIYMACTESYELTEEEKKAFEAGTATDNPERYAIGKIYDTESKSWSESEVLNEVSIMLFEKWKGGSLTSYGVFPIFCKDSSSEEEVYYLAHNDGVYRISEAGEELIYFNPDWNSKKKQL